MSNIVNASVRPRGKAVCAVFGITKIGGPHLHRLVDTGGVYIQHNFAPFFSLTKNYQPISNARFFSNLKTTRRGHGDYVMQEAPGKKEFKRRCSARG
jgi:hypothetical protein